MLQKVVTVNLEKLCEERFAAEGCGPDTMSEEEGIHFFARVLDDFLEQQNKAGLKVAIASSEIHLSEELVFLCTESQITAPQHAKIIRLWEEGELDELAQVNRTGIADLRIKGALAEMNAAHLAVDAMAIFTPGSLLAIVTEV